MDRNLALEVVRVTEAAALAAARFVGRGDGEGADRAATEAMRKTFGFVHLRGRVVIGEGERDEAPMLYMRAMAMGIADLDHVFAIDELARGDVMFAATGVTDGFLLRGVRFTATGADTNSIVMRSHSGSVRFLQTRHRVEGHPVYGGASHR